MIGTSLKFQHKNKKKSWTKRARIVSKSSFASIKKFTFQSSGSSGVKDFSASKEHHRLYLISPTLTKIRSPLFGSNQRKKVSRIWLICLFLISMRVQTNSLWSSTPNRLITSSFAVKLRRIYQPFKISFTYSLIPCVNKCKESKCFCWVSKTRPLEMIWRVLCVPI